MNRVAWAASAIPGYLGRPQPIAQGFGCLNALNERTIVYWLYIIAPPLVFRRCKHT
jgi:hypothetical protein